ncbi:TPA: type II secretion system F family protein [Pasteurella multocida]|nr:type II secretion system F family protein [Pasteurella multocida]
MAKLKMYRWKAKNRLQQKQQGMLVAENEIIAQQMLFERGFFQIKLQQNWQFSTQPKQTELCDLLTQLATLLQSALPLKEALQVLLQNTTNIQLNQWLRTLLTQLESGVAFSVALTSLGSYLNYQELQLIKVGEMTGRLAQVCQQIAQYRQQSLVLQRKVQKIMLYPSMIVGISLLLTLVLLLFIVPEFASMYQNQTLPVFTALLFNLSEGLTDYGFLLLILTIFIGFSVRHYSKHSKQFQQQKERFLSIFPLLKRIRQQHRLIRFCTNLHLMLVSGIPLHQALQSFLPQQHFGSKRELQDDPILSNEVRWILQEISQGYAFSEAVSSSLFPYDAQQMLQIGEKSGRFVVMLQNIAEVYQKKLEHQLDLLSQLIEPFLMLIIGGLIGLIMLGMYLPIFNMGAIVQ